MNAVIAAIDAAVPTPTPAPPPPVNELVQDVEHGVTLAAAGNVEGALCTRTLAALARLLDEHPAAHSRLRSALMRSDRAVTGPLVERLVREHGGADDAADEPHESDSRPGAVEQLVEQVQALGELFTAPDGAAYARLHASPRAVQALGSRAFRETVAHAFYRDTRRAPKAAQLADAMTTLAGIAQHEGEVRDVHLRVAVDPAGGYLLDMCDDGWRVIRITPTGWQVLDESPVAFRRTAGMKALPEPARDGTRDDLVSLFNIEREDEVLMIASLAETLRPDTPYPINEFRGEQGSGKSRTMGNARALVDPHASPLRAPARSLQDLYVSAGNNHVLTQDNVSSMSGDAQDGLCVMATGGAVAQRTLYTDADETTISVKRPAWLSTISTPFTRPDALSRVVPFECPPLDGGTRLSDAELSAALERTAPKALGYLLDTLCDALARLPSIELTEAPRLLDFTKLGEAIAQGEGHAAGCFTGRYVGALAATAMQSLEAEPVVTTLAALLDEHGGEIGIRTVEELRADLAACATRTGSASPPTQARALGALLSRYAPALRQAGVVVKFERRSGRGRRVSISGKFSSDGDVQSLRTTCTTCTTYTDEAESARCARRARRAGAGDTDGKETSGPPGAGDASPDLALGRRIVGQLRGTGRAVGLGPDGAPFIRPDIGTGAPLGQEVRERQADIAAALIDERDATTSAVAS